MAKEFTVKEAKQLIEQHKTLIADLDYVANRGANIKADIRRAVDELISQPTLKRLIFSDCTAPADVSVKCAGTEMLVYHLYKFQRVQSSIEAASAFQSYAHANVQQNLTALNPGLAGLSWLLGGKRARENATHAYQELSHILKGNYGQTVPHLVTAMNEVATIPTDVAWESFVSDPFSFSDTLENLYSEPLHAKGSNPFRSLLSQLTEIEQKTEKCRSATDKEKERIKAAAERMMAYNALQILRGVPVEEVNREKGGFRVKTLRDAGFTTMADIYTAASHQLSSLHGISESAALSMKRIAKQLLDEANEDVKIKLNADDRSKPATELVKAIYLYRLKNAACKELRELTQSRQAGLEQGREVLNAVESGLPWLFYSTGQRAEVRAAYRDITSAVEGEYAKKITKLTRILSAEQDAPDADAAWNDFLQHNIDYFSALEDVVPGALGNDDGLYGLPEDLAREIQEEVLFPDGLLCTLRRYQEWGVKYILHQKKVLLGDEMGLGKTVQAIAAMVSLRNTGATHFLVVCPASVITNWCREVRKHSRLSVTKVHGAGRTQALRSWVKTGGVAITTYETTAYIKDDSMEDLNMLIVDEAHYIKNPEARRSINVKRLCAKAERLLFMTGTALENRVEEMVSLIEVLQPDVAAAVKSMTFMPNAPQFRSRVAPVYYRRKREDVLTELPELIESKEWCTLNPEEEAIYEENVLARKYMATRRLSWDVDDLAKSCKAARLLEIIEQAQSEDRKVLVFSFFLDTIRAIGKRLEGRCYGPINGSVPPSRRQEIIDAFDEAPAGSVLLAQIQSGGTGLNIQSASVVVICEPQLKPSTETQAISRAYRMGQARNVLVYRLLGINTIDERITELLEQKQEIFDAFADKSVAAEQTEARSVEVDEKTFGQLIQEEIDRIIAEKGKNLNEGKKS